ncbi:MAG: hypothetical protein ACI9CA_001210 [Natronomonas sp.]|jgi:hypothetical protein
MLFPTHVIAGYVLGHRLRLPALPAAAGAALPDIVDKPPAMLGLLDLYHSVGHSALVFLPVLVAGLVVSPGRAWIAVCVGWVAHLALDATHMLVNGRPADTAFLLWPAVIHYPDIEFGPLEFFAFYIGSPSFFIEMVVWVGAAALVWRALVAGNDRATDRV